MDEGLGFLEKGRGRPVWTLIGGKLSRADAFDPVPVDVPLVVRRAAMIRSPSRESHAELNARRVTLAGG